MFFFALTLGLGESLHGPGSAFPRGSPAFRSGPTSAEPGLLGPSPPDWLVPVPGVLPVLVGLLSGVVTSVLRSLAARPVTGIPTLDLER